MHGLPLIMGVTQNYLYMYGGYSKLTPGSESGGGGLPAHDAPWKAAAHRALLLAGEKGEEAIGGGLPLNPQSLQGYFAYKKTTPPRTLQ